MSDRPTIEALLRRRFVDQGNRQLVLSQTPDSRWQASMLRPGGSAYAVATGHADPVEAVFAVLADFSERTPPKPQFQSDFEDIL